jgi:hypothetical protein
VILPLAGTTKINGHEQQYNCSFVSSATWSNFE